MDNLKIPAKFNDLFQADDISNVEQIDYGFPIMDYDLSAFNETNLNNELESKFCVFSCFSVFDFTDTSSPYLNSAFIFFLFLYLL
jgi:hypothetical protein